MHKRWMLSLFTLALPLAVTAQDAPPRVSSQLAGTGEDVLSFRAHGRAESTSRFGNRFKVKVAGRADAELGLDADTKVGVERYQADLGFRFSTYAYRAIARNAYRAIMDQRKASRRFMADTEVLTDTWPASTKRTWPKPPECCLQTSTKLTMVPGWSAWLTSSISTRNDPKSSSSSSPTSPSSTTSLAPPTVTQKA